jgi:WD40 repeat protein
VAFSSDGNRLAAGGNGMECIKIWDMHSHRELLTLAGKGTGYTQTAFSPDGSTLATLNYHRHHLYLWRAPSWREIEEAEASGGQAATD